MSKERIILLTLAAINFTHIMDFMIIMPLGDMLMKVFDIGPQQFSFIVASYTISAGVSGFIAAFLIDRFDRKTALIFLYIGFTVGTLACALAPTYVILLVARSLTGVFGGILGALLLAVLADVVPEERRGQGMGFIMAAFSVASVAGVPFGYFLAEKISWHAPFLLLSGFGLVILYMIWRYIPSLTAHMVSKSDRPGIRKVLHNAFSLPNQQRALLFMMLLMLGQFTIIPFIAPYMIRNVGFESNQITYIYLIGGALTIFTSPIIGKLADKYGKLRVFTVFAILNILPLFAITHMPPVHIALALTVTGAFFIISGGRMIPAMAMITSSVKPQNRGSFMSINSSVQQLSAGLASFIAGLIVVQANDGSALQNYQYVGYVAIFATILCIIVGQRIVPAESVQTDKQTESSENLEAEVLVEEAK
ncbi:MFS transporter [Cytophagales bacterium LB-30]|uniref:MFS transporter n=1 Tax=Shiella aurantiaca TaxID=3058365 RepID=A0ABT8F7A2_9BACT|nr:MFS transporter [Shiella aurantiaca]MDN4166249.1 MFS transporter [Shiella aurantiaca]